MLLLLTIVMPCLTWAQCDEIVRVDFKIKGKRVDFAHKMDLTFCAENQEIKPILYVNGFIVPDFGSLETIDVCFTYRKDKYLVEGLPVVKFESNWTFGIKKRTRKTLIFYTEFSPRNGGCGTEVVVTIAK